MKVFDNIWWYWWYLSYRNTEQYLVKVTYSSSNSTIFDELRYEKYAEKKSPLMSYHQHRVDSKSFT